MNTDVIIVRNCRTSGLGIKIVGGKCTVGGSDYGIFVKKILAGGRAEAEGHLQEGDQILEVNGETMLGVSNDKAISILRKAAESNNVKLLISRDHQARQEFTSLMAALSGNALGGVNGPGALDLLRNNSRSSSRASTPSPTMEKRSWVMNAGRMSPLALGRHGSPNWSPSSSLDRPPPSLQRMQAVDLPSASELANPGTVDPPPYQNSNLLHLNLGPSSSHRNVHHYHSNGDSVSPKVSPKHCAAELQSDSEVTIDSGLQTDRHSSTPSPTFDHPGELQVVRIPITTGLGLCVVGGTNRPEGPHIYVDGIIEGGDAHMNNKLQQGDQIVTVNGETLVGVTHEQAKSILTRLKLRKDLTVVEIAFIRGGNTGYIPSNQLDNSSISVNDQEEEEQNESPQLSSRSSLDSARELDGYLNEMPHTSSESSTGMNRTTPRTHFLPNGHQQSSAVPMSSYPVNTFPQPVNHSQGGYPQPVNHSQGGYPNYYSTNGGSLSLPAGNGGMQPYQRHGFQPTVSSTPNGLPNGNSLPISYGQMNGYHPGMAPHQHQNETISPIGPSLQPSSVPFYLQQDLEALRRVSEQYPSSGTQSRDANTSPTTTLSQKQRRTRAERSSRKLSLDPYTKIKVEKLEVALRYLGFEPSEEQQRMLRMRLPIDQNGCTTYGEFVNASRDVFAVKLNEPNLNTSAFQFAIQDINAMEQKMQHLEAQQQAAETEAVARQTSEDLEILRRERDEALREVQHLRKALKKKEQHCTESSEEVKRIRKQTQELLEESRSLQNRIHLASQAQEASKNVEQDYEEVIKLLEKEVDDLKLKNSQKGPDPKDLEDLQKRLVVLGCQLRKAEVSKRTYEVSTEKLIKFAELVHDVLSRGGNELPQQRGRGEPARRDTTGSRPPSYLSRHAKHNSSTLAKEAREVVKSVKALIEEEPLPFGWEEAYTPDGVRYYINHVTQQTSWLHPVSHVQHLPPIMENKDEGAKETRT